MAMYPDLAGKVAVVTGGSKGLGNAIVHRFAQEGMSVVINYNTDLNGAAQTVYEIEKLGGHAIAIKGGVETEEGNQALLDAALETFGGLDIWVSNAGFETQNPTHEVSLDEWNRQIAVNLTGPFLGAKAALNYWLPNNKAGNIINMSSIHELIPWPTYAAYTTSKGGLSMFNKTLAMEYAESNIRVNAIGPGAMDTPINAKRFEDNSVRQETESMIPMQKIGDPYDVADAAAWLASNQSKYVTGQTLFVDGGITLYEAFDGGKG